MESIPLECTMSSYPFIVFRTVIPSLTPYTPDLITIKAAVRYHFRQICFLLLVLDTPRFLGAGFGVGFLPRFAGLESALTPEGFTEALCPPPAPLSWLPKASVYPAAQIERMSLE